MDNREIAKAVSDTLAIVDIALETSVAQLRHAYQQLHAGTVVDQKKFAEGLIGPQIEYLERVIHILETSSREFADLAE